MLKMNQSVNINLPDHTTGTFKGYHIHPSTGERTGVYVRYATNNPPVPHEFGMGVGLFSMGTITPKEPT